MNWSKACVASIYMPEICMSLMAVTKEAVAITWHHTTLDYYETKTTRHGWYVKNTVKEVIALK